MNPTKTVKKRHIIAEIGFKDGYVICSCGEEMTPMIVAPDAPWDKLNTAFYEHRKSQGEKNGSNADLGHSREEQKPFVIKRA